MILSTQNRFSTYIFTHLTYEHTPCLAVSMMAYCGWSFTFSHNRLKVKSKKKNSWKNRKLSRIILCIPRVRIQPVTVGWVPRCGCGAEIGRCQPVRSGSSPAAYRRGKPPLPVELLPHGSPPPAAADWPPDERSQTVRFNENSFGVFIFPFVERQITDNNWVKVSFNCVPIMAV